MSKSSAAVEEDLFQAWNEAEKLHCSLRELADDELIFCREAMQERCEKIMSFLHDHVRGNYEADNDQ